MLTCPPRSTSRPTGLPPSGGRTPTAPTLTPPATPTRPGGLQMVFSDLGTPRETWNVYDELRDQLTARGVPTGQVAFIHTAATPREKERLFERCRTGDVQV